MHIDSDGLGTFIKTQCGGKWWIIFGPPAGKTKHVFGSVSQFLASFDTNREEGGRWDLDKEDIEEGDLWIAEAVYLSPGTELFVIFLFFI